MEKPREICSTEELDYAHRSTKSKGGIRPSRSREELDQIIELLDRQSTRTRDFQHQGKNNFPWTKPVTLKQALRRSCISHASEAAAMRKLSRPKVLSEISDVGAVMVEEKRKLLEISEASEHRRAAFSRLLRLKEASETGYYEDETKKGNPPRGGQRIREKGECSQSSKSSSSSTSNSEESEKRRKPHMSRDLRWVAIRRAEMNQGGIRLKNFKLLRRLGCGDIGTVYVARLVGSECLYALKVMDEEFLWSRMKMPRAETEREILQMLDHPFLPTLYAHFSEDNLSCLVMEYCPGGDLHVLRQKQPLRSFPEPAARFFVAEVLLALEYLHMLGVIYRDLKPENILVREDGHIMLSDFDLSLRCSVAPVLLRSSLSAAREIPADVFACADPLCSVSCLPAAGGIRSRDRGKSLPMLVAEPTEARSNSFVGTHEYLAPEIIKGEGHGSSVDWWTLGIFLYELLFGRTPFKGAGDEETLRNIATQDLRFPETFTATIQARDLIRRLLVKDPARRIGSVRGAAEIKRHCFFDGLNWALIRCTVPPEIRSAAEELVYPMAAPSAASVKKQSRCLDFSNDEIRQFGLF